jgi:hypothetical protein
MKWWQIKKRREADLEREPRSDLELEEEEQRALREAIGKSTIGPWRAARCDLRWLKRSERHRQDKHHRGPSTPRHQAVCHAINL